MEQAVEHLESKVHKCFRISESKYDYEKKKHFQMKETDEKMGNLAQQVGNIESGIFSETGEQIEVNDLLKSVSEVKSNYQNLRKDLMEVQDLQKQLSSTLHMQLKLMQAKFNMLKEKLPEAPVSSLKASRRQCGQDK